MYVLDTKEQSVRVKKLFAQMSVSFDIEQACDEKWTEVWY